MKDLIIKLLAALHDGSLEIKPEKFSSVGGCMDVTVGLPASDLAFSCTFERSDIVAQLYRDGLICRYDPTTRQVFMANNEEPPIRPLWELMLDLSTSYTEQMVIDMLRNCLHGALVIVDADEPAEDLFNRFWHEYNYFERQALLWRLIEQGRIDDYQTAMTVQHILNYYDGSITYFPINVDMRIRLFAVWLKNNHGSLYALCRGMDETTPKYTKNSTYGSI